MKYSSFTSKVILHTSFLFAVAIAIKPIIVVPGFGGSRITAKVNEERDDHIFCSRHIKNYELMWVNIEYLLPITIRCLTERMALRYDGQTNRTYNREGISTRTVGWGDIEDIEYLGNLHFGPVDYFATFVKAMVENHGYKRGISIRGAPYDFRKAPNELDVYEKNFKTLVEDTYTLNGGKKVILLAHSYGCPVTLRILQRAKQVWKDKYIESFVSVEGPYYGSVVALQMLALGYNPNIPTVEASWLRKMEQTWPTAYFLLPDSRAWSKNEMILHTPSGNYSANDFKQIIQDINVEDGWDHYINTRQLIDPLKPPGVNVFCIAGRGLPTTSSIDCSHQYGWPQDTSECKKMTGDGDGTVNWRSLKVCQSWSETQSQDFNFHVIPYANHFKVLSNSKFIDYFAKSVIGGN